MLTERLVSDLVFDRFISYKGPTRPDHTLFDFLGSFVHHDFLRGLEVTEDPAAVEAPYPSVDEDFPAWLDLLLAVDEAKDAFVMLEVGAGFGVWRLRGGLAARQRGLSPKLMAVEAHPEHFCWLRRHLAAHGLEADLVQAAVSDYEGDADFEVSLPEHEFWYGQSLWVQNGATSTRVPVVTLPSLLEQFNRIDFIHVDVQGEEQKILPASIEELSRKVRRIHIGTHSPEIEGELRELFTAAGWRPIWDYPGQQTNITPWGQIQFGDGAQSWLNAGAEALY